MNELNQLEKQLQSWIPRSPSAKLSQRIFPARTEREENAIIVVPLWAKLAAAMCILLIGISLGVDRREKTSVAAAVGGSNMLASLSSNLIAYCATDTRMQHLNIWNMPSITATFDWTKSGHSLSTTGSFPLWKTNIQKL